MHHYFDGVTLGQLVFHMNVPLNGTGTSSFTSAIIKAILLAVFVLFIVVFVSVLSIKKQIRWSAWLSIALALCVLVVSVIMAEKQFQIVDYIKMTHETTKIYETDYVDPNDVNIDFDGEQRNLIYIFLESMETTYADIQSGGGMSDDNYIPNITELSLNNNDFSANDKINGAVTVVGCEFTLGGVTAQTSGTPINEMMISNEAIGERRDSDFDFLPGVVTIGDILAENGYTQEIMFGSDARFAGRLGYFSQHGNYKIFDYYTAIERGYIEEDYYQWWGYEDKKLFEYAKEEIMFLSKSGKPFNFSMLTADTHFTNGYCCEDCINLYGVQYSNVIHCSDNKLMEFIGWIQKQDFYDNTTIIIAGDHVTMDSAYIEQTNTKDFDRKTVFCIINPSDKNKDYVEKERLYTAVDLFPTTIAALGGTIEGNRLGLGVNLYSDEQTLIERYDETYLNRQFYQYSKYYGEKLMN